MTCWSGWIAEADTGLPADFAPNGFVVTALQAAWSAIRHPWADDSADGRGSLVAAVHAGNDTDTVAAIAGALLGAAHGAGVRPGAVAGRRPRLARPARRRPARPRAPGVAFAPLTAQPRPTPVTVPARDGSTVISTRFLPGFFAQ